MPTTQGEALGESPADILNNNVVATPSQVAVVLGLVKVKGAEKGAPDVRRARDLIRSGALALVDPLAPASRWTVATTELRRYVAEGPRRGVA